mmetsp:Transcript_38912/g.81394  ORF Transcript_38912/g.81394 Transcript_38912/m.81394 type:complete len:703 (-) Transcript_38912:30-2138(-)
MDHDSKVESKVDQTIQWARESLQRRRSELLEEKQNLIASYKSGERSSSPSTKQTDLHSMLERGRTLLAEAEAHSHILEQYASSGKSSEGMYHAVEEDQSPLTTISPRRGSKNDSHSANDDFMAQFLQETNRDDEHGFDSNTCESVANSQTQRKASQLPVEMPDWDNERVENDRPSQSPTFDGNEELQELLREGEARARLDELIATVRRRGDDTPSKHEGMVASPTKSISNFDPSSLKAARRAALKKIKWDEEVAAAEKDARLLTSFKALPLPGGAEVKNNLFASTQSFQGKQIGSVEKLVRRDTKCDKLNDTSSSISGTFGAFEGISIVTSRTSHEDSFSVYGYETEADRERAKQLREEKKMKKRQLLDSVNQTIEGDIQASIEDGGVSTFYGESGDMVEDPSKLRQDIARLEAKLKQKKTKRLATLNDIVDIDLNALFDRLLSREAEEDVKHVIDRLKGQVCGSANDFQYHIMPDMKSNLIETNEPQRKSLFRRHEEWAEEREQKLFAARVQLEAEAMHGITGAPELSHATRSWRKAKGSHDETLKRVAEEKSRKQHENDVKEKAANESKHKEMEELQKQANSKLKSLKSEVNKEEQLKRLEILSRPRQIREIPMRVESGVDLMHGEQPNTNTKSKIFLPVTPKRRTKPTERGKSKSEEKVVKSFNTMSDKKPDEFCGKPSFSEISDKDFAKLVKKITLLK